MSVVKAKRKESRFEVLHHFFVVRKELTLLCYNGLKYKGDNDFKTWMVQSESHKVMDILSEAQKYITMANSIYPTTIAECDERRLLQDKVIGLMFAIIQELQFTLTAFGFNLNKYAYYTKLIEQEVSLLKGWRASDNKIRSKIIG